MLVLGQKVSQVSQGGSQSVVTDVTAWTLLGLALDHLFKVWARHGAASLESTEVYREGKVKVCHVVRKGSQRWPPPGVERWSELPDGALSLAMRLLRVTKEHLHVNGWRVFTGDLDLKSRCGQHQGAVDGVADCQQNPQHVALIELKVRRRREVRELEADASLAALELDAKWSKNNVPHLKCRWTHGILVTHYQGSPCRSYATDFARVAVWVKDAAASAVVRHLSAGAPSRAQPQLVQKRLKVCKVPWCEVRRQLECGSIRRKVAAKVKSYLKAVSSRASAKKSLELWKRRFGWADDVCQQQGGAKQGACRSGGTAAYYLLLSCVRQVHQARTAGAL